jgi:MoxR-like ATPase
VRANERGNSKFSRPVFFAVIHGTLATDELIDRPRDRGDARRMGTSTSQVDTALAAEANHEQIAAFRNWVEREFYADSAPEGMDRGPLATFSWGPRPDAPKGGSVAVHVGAWQRLSTARHAKKSCLQLVFRRGDSDEKLDLFLRADAPPKDNASAIAIELAREPAGLKTSGTGRKDVLFELSQPEKLTLTWKARNRPTQTNASGSDETNADAFDLNALKDAWFPPSNPEHSMATSLRTGIAWDRVTLKECWPDASEGFTTTLNVDDSTGFAEATLSWFLLFAFVTLHRDPAFIEDRKKLGFPGPADFAPIRNVDLVPTEVLDDLTRAGFDFPAYLVEAACTSLNAGKSVILTGPPGCGKTELAVRLARHALARLRGLDNRLEPLVCTATATWTTGDVVGRYWPKEDGHGLEFQPGFFLRAFESKQWLVIDELNRAPFNECLGELFTVLSGQDVDLPFKKGGELVRITHQPKTETTGGTYLVPPGFRFIGTMNDADRTALNALSFALLRRVDIIRVDAPPSVRLPKLIKERFRKKALQARFENYGYVFKKQNVVSYRAYRDLATEDDASAEPEFSTLEKLVYAVFAPLLEHRVVGVATCQETIDFVMEGLRASNGKERQAVALANPESTESPFEADDVAASYVAMAVVLKVFPQLEGLPDREAGGNESRGAVTKKVLSTFDEADYSFVRVVKATTGDAPFALATEPDVKTCADFLLRELKRYFPYDKFEMPKAGSTGAA